MSLVETGLKIKLKLNYMRSESRWSFELGCVMFSVQVASQLPQDLLFVDAEINAHNNVINKFLQTVSENWQKSQNGRLSQSF